MIANENCDNKANSCCEAVKDLGLFVQMIELRACTILLHLVESPFML